MATTYWDAPDYCRVNDNPEPISTGIVFDGEIVAKLTAGFYPENNGIRDIVLSGLIEKPDSAFGSAFTKALTPNGVAFDPSWAKPFKNSMATNSRNTMIGDT